MRSRLGGAWRIDVGAGSVDGGSEARRERRIRSHCYGNSERPAQILRLLLVKELPNRRYRGLKIVLPVHVGPSNSYAYMTWSSNREEEVLKAQTSH